MTVYISDHHRQLTESFNELKDELQTPTRFEDQLSGNEILNEFDRYRVWADNVGAAQYGSNYSLSLDYRFREAPFYRDQASKTMIPMRCLDLPFH
jgi:hypothetical protein